MLVSVTTDSNAHTRSLVGYFSGFFFFQAEDGIRDLTVTGVQTCALPICARRLLLLRAPLRLQPDPADVQHDAEPGDALALQPEPDGRGPAPPDRKSVV